MAFGTASIETSIASNTRSPYPGSTVKRIIWTVTSSAGGGTGGSVEATTPVEIIGTLKRVTFQPHKTLKPTAAWDCYLFSQTASLESSILQYGSVDILGGKGMNLIETGPTQVTFGSMEPPLINDNVRLTCYNMGTTTKAKIVAYIE